MKACMLLLHWRDSITQGLLRFTSAGPDSIPFSADPADVAAGPRCDHTRIYPNLPSILPHQLSVYHPRPRVIKEGKVNQQRHGFQTYGFYVRIRSVHIASFSAFISDRDVDQVRAMSWAIGS